MRFVQMCVLSVFLKLFFSWRVLWLKEVFCVDVWYVSAWLALYEFCCFFHWFIYKTFIVVFELIMLLLKFSFKVLILCETMKCMVQSQVSPCSLSWKLQWCCGISDFAILSINAFFLWAVWWFLDRLKLTHWKLMLIWKWWYVNASLLWI